MSRSHALRRNRGTRRSAALLSVLAASLLPLFVLSGCSGGKDEKPRTITVYAFSVLDEVMSRGIQPAFQEHWREKTGERVEFVTTFAGSGTITEEIIRRFPAEVAILSSEMDALRLVDKGVVPGPTWKSLPNGGIFSRSPLVLLVRSGNPKGVKGVTDLAVPGVRTVLPDPHTSGVAEWGILALYGAVFLESGDREAAKAALDRFRPNIVGDVTSARSAVVRFLEGEGDALFSYEGEARRIAASGESPSVLVYPKKTILVEPVAVVIRRNVAMPQTDLVNGFVEFLWSRQAQEILARHGFRGAIGDVNTGSGFPKIESPFTLKDLGGARDAKKKVLDEAWDKTVPGAGP